MLVRQFLNLVTIIFVVGMNQLSFYLMEKEYRKIESKKQHISHFTLQISGLPKQYRGYQLKEILE